MGYYLVCSLDEIKHIVQLGLIVIMEKNAYATYQLR
jgi:hypothetical protein